MFYISRQQSQKKFYNVQLTYNPRESGVVSLRNCEQHAISPARVLLGVVASALPNVPVKVEELIAELTRTLDVNDIAEKDAGIDVLLGVTLGDLYAHGNIFFYSKKPKHNFTLNLRCSRFE